MEFITDMFRNEIKKGSKVLYFPSMGEFHAEKAVVEDVHIKTKPDWKYPNGQKEIITITLDCRLFGMKKVRNPDRLLVVDTLNTDGWMELRPDGKN